MNINYLSNAKIINKHRNNSLHELFLFNCINSPESIALNCDGVVTTYLDLNRLADEAAASLVKMGVTPGSYVPILLPRSKELIISILAVLKAGAAYSLMDMNWPESRLCEIIKILKPPLLIAEKRLTNYSSLVIWSPSNKNFLDFNKFDPIEVDADSPCCVFFTSGTSGKPKAVISPHRGTIRLFSKNKFADFGQNTIIPLAAAVAWDAFSLELWGALLNGGTSWISNEPYLSAAALRKGVLQCGVNTIWITSSLFNMIIDEDIDAFLGLHQVITGGERLSVSHVKKFLIKHPKITLINGYGPVESTVFATTHHVTLNDCRRVNGIPIGLPVNNTQLYVIKDNVCCGEGEIGEICISGDGLAIKYLCDPDLTNEKFRQIKINGRLTLMYCTGDLGVWKDGLFHFNGRMDRQIKIRGNRVELSEVERQIESILPNVRACRIVLKKDEIDHKLIAFCITTNNEDTLDGANKILKSKLVSYHCPSEIIAIKTFPLTQHGKIDDHKLLENIFILSINLSPTPVAKQDHNPIRSKVIEVFSEVLNKAIIPSNIHILELGGTSLSIGRICARLTNKLGYVVPVSWLYRFPTIDTLVNYLQKTNSSIDISVSDINISQPLMSSMQLSYLIRYIVNPKDRTSHCLMTWIIRGDLDQKSLESAIQYVHQRHEALRAKYISDPSPSIQLTDIYPPNLILLEAQHSIHEAIDLLRHELSAELDPTIGRIWRTAITSLKSEKIFIFGCVVHHIAFDGWSESILATDLSVGYNTARGIDKISLQSPPSLTTVHVARISLLTQSSSFSDDNLLSAELEGIRELRWPVCEKNYSRAHENCDEICVLLSKELIEGVDKIAIDTRSSRFEVLLACWAQAIAEITGQKDFCIGTPVRQRYTIEIEHSIGCFINMVCLRMREEALEEGKKGIIGTSKIVQRAFSNQEVSLEKMIELAHPQRSKRPPIFQTLFALQDNPPPNLSLYGIDCEFWRQPYIELPLELHAEIWPSYNNELNLVVSYHSNQIPTTIIKQLLKAFTNRLYKLICI